MECNVCGKELFGKVGIIDEVKYYGFFCKECKKWQLRGTKFLFNKLTPIDNTIYKVKLVGGENIHQLKRIAEMANISFPIAQAYLPIGEEIVLFERKAEGVSEIISLAMKADLYFEIEPEYPFEIYKELSEETEEITARIKMFIEAEKE